jgi:hypothetical protein
MKIKTFFAFIILILSHSVAFAINNQIQVYTVPDSTCNPIIFRGKNMFGLDAKYAGNLAIGDQSFSFVIKRYSDSVVTAVLKAEACAVNANLVNITLEIKPGEIRPNYQQVNYYRCMADFYSIDLNELNLKILRAENRKIIRYEEKNTLSGNDFDNELPESYSVPYEFISTIELYFSKVSIWTGIYKNFEAQGVFYSDISKIKKSFSSEQAMQQIELLFSLTQLYAKRLESDLNSRKPKLSNPEKIQKIIDGYISELETEKVKLNTETEYGSNSIELKKWETKIKSELDQFELKNATKK